jgi:hypothetical protein
MRTLIERTEPKSGDYVGSGTVTQVPKKKKMKRMQMGGKVMNPSLAAAVSGSSPRGTGTNDGGPAPSAMGNLGAVKTPVRGPAMPYGGMGGPVRKGLSVVDQAMPVRGGGGVPLQGPGGVMVKPPRTETKPRPERPSIRGKSMRDLRAGVGPSGIRPDPVSGRQPTPVPRVDMTAPRQPGQKGYGMKGGGLARKGVGMALAKGGLVKANGCAQRGKTKGRMM